MYVYVHGHIQDANKEQYKSLYNSDGTKRRDDGNKMITNASKEYGTQRKGIK